jgi:hypothetical protein
VDIPVVVTTPGRNGRDSFGLPSPTRYRSVGKWAARVPLVNGSTRRADSVTARGRSVRHADGRTRLKRSWTFVSSKSFVFVSRIPPYPATRRVIVTYRVDTRARRSRCTQTFLIHFLQDGTYYLSVHRRSVSVSSGKRKQPQTFSFTFHNHRQKVD